MDLPSYGENLIPQEATQPVWSQTALAWIAILLNFWTESYFQALNYERLGKPELKRPRLIQYSLAGVLMCMVIVLSSLSPRAGVLGYAPLLANILFGLQFYKSQSAQYKKHLAAGGPKASLVAPLLTAFVFVGILLLLGLAIDLVLT
jgi:hypothetical protein